MDKQKGKTFTIFVILVIVLLISSTAIGFFMYSKESQLRKSVEEQLQESNQVKDRLSNDLKDTRKQLALLEDKNKEADAKINNLMDEMELNEGLRNELKKDNAALKDAIDVLKKEKEKIHADLDDTAKKLQENQELLKAEQEKSKDLQTKMSDLEKAKQQAVTSLEDLKAQIKPYNSLTADQQVAGEMLPPAQSKGKMELDKIVVGGQETGGTKGRVLSVDTDTEFIVSSLGASKGVKYGDFLSVYRGDEYLGDVKVTRVQDEMSAADFIPPFSSRKVRKNDIVVLKQS